MLASASPAGADEVTPEADGRARIAILPMVVNTAGERAYLRSGLADMLASRLGRNPELAVIRVEDESQATSDPRRAAEIGLAHGAQYVVFGAFTQFGEGASLDVQCVEARAYEKKEDPAARSIFIQSGTVGEIIPKLDTTAQKIGLFIAGSATAGGAPAPGPPVAAAPSAPAAAPQAAPAREAAFEDLRRRLEAIEEYLFGGEVDRLAGPATADDAASQEFRLR